MQNAKTKDEKMITLNDYLYSGDTVFRILKKYSEDLKRAAEENQSEVDLDRKSTRLNSSHNA